MPFRSKTAGPGESGEGLEEICPPHLRAATRQLMPLLYHDLKRLARQERNRHISPNTLTTTSLVHTAFLRLDSKDDFASHAHFLRVAAITMRHLLIDRARAQMATKHGGSLTRVEMEEAADFYVEDDARVLAVHDALLRLAKKAPRLAQIVECRFFAGYRDEEIAQALGIGLRTVERDWALARAWLYKELGEAAGVLI